MAFNSTFQGPPKTQDVALTCLQTTIEGDDKKYLGFAIYTNNIFQTWQIVGPAPTGVDLTDPESFNYCEEDQSSCVKWSSLVTGMDNTGTRFSGTYTFLVTMTDGSTETIQQTPTGGWTAQLNQWVGLYQAILPNALVEARCNLPAGCGGLLPPPSDVNFNLMKWRYLQITACPTDRIPVKVEIVESSIPAHLGKVLDLEFYTTPEKRGYVCNTCGEVPELYYRDTGLPVPEADLPICYFECSETLPETPTASCSTDFEEAGCDNLNDPDSATWIPIFRRYVTCDALEPTIEYYSLDNTDPTAPALVDYTLVGQFVDCETGEPIPEPDPCKDFVIDWTYVYGCTKNHPTLPDGLKVKWLEGVDCLGNVVVDETVYLCDQERTELTLNEDCGTLGGAQSLFGSGTDTVATWTISGDSHLVEKVDTGAASWIIASQINNLLTGSTPRIFKLTGFKDGQEVVGVWIDPISGWTSNLSANTTAEPFPITFNLIPNRIGNTTGCAVVDSVIAASPDVVAPDGTYELDQIRIGWNQVNGVVESTTVDITNHLQTGFEGITCDCDVDCGGFTGNCMCYEGASDNVVMSEGGSFSMNLTTIKFVNPTNTFIEDCINGGDAVTLEITDTNGNIFVFVADSILSSGDANSGVYTGTGVGGASGTIQSITVTCGNTTGSAKACQWVSCDKQVVKWFDGTKELTDAEIATLVECTVPVTNEPPCNEQLVSFINCADEVTPEVALGDQIMTVAVQDCTGIIISSKQYNVTQGNVLLTEPVLTTDCDPAPEVETLVQCIVDTAGTRWTLLSVIDAGGVAIGDPIYINQETLDIGTPEGEPKEWQSCIPEGIDFEESKVCGVDNANPGVPIKAYRRTYYDGTDNTVLYFNFRGFSLPLFQEYCCDDCIQVFGCRDGRLAFPIGSTVDLADGNSLDIAGLRYSQVAQLIVDTYGGTYIAPSLGGPIGPQFSDCQGSSQHEIQLYNVPVQVLSISEMTNYGVFGACSFDKKEVCAPPKNDFCYYIEKEATIRPFGDAADGTGTGPDTSFYGETLDGFVKGTWETTTPTYGSGPNQFVPGLTNWFVSMFNSGSGIYANTMRLNMWSKDACILESFIRMTDIDDPNGTNKGEVYNISQAYGYSSLGEYTFSGSPAYYPLGTYTAVPIGTQGTLQPNGDYLPNATTSGAGLQISYPSGFSNQVISACTDQGGQSVVWMYVRYLAPLRAEVDCDTGEVTLWDDFSYDEQNPYVDGKPNLTSVQVAISEAVLRPCCQGEEAPKLGNFDPFSNCDTESSTTIRCVDGNQTVQDIEGNDINLLDGDEIAYNIITCGDTVLAISIVAINDTTTQISLPAPSGPTEPDPVPFNTRPCSPEPSIVGPSCVEDEKGTKWDVFQIVSTVSGITNIYYNQQTGQAGTPVGTVTECTAEGCFTVLIKNYCVQSRGSVKSIKTLAVKKQTTLSKVARTTTATKELSKFLSRLEKREAVQPIKESTVKPGKIIDVCEERIYDCSGTYLTSTYIYQGKQLDQETFEKLGLVVVPCDSPDVTYSPAAVTCATELRTDGVTVVLNCQVFTNDTDPTDTFTQYTLAADYTTEGIGAIGDVYVPEEQLSVVACPDGSITEVVECYDAQVDIKGVAAAGDNITVTSIANAVAGTTTYTIVHTTSQSVIYVGSDPLGDAGIDLSDATTWLVGPCGEPIEPVNVEIHTPKGLDVTGNAPYTVPDNPVESITIAVRTGRVTVTTPAGTMTVFARETFTWGQGDANYIDSSALTFQGQTPNTLYRVTWEMP